MTHRKLTSERMRAHVEGAKQRQIIIIIVIIMTSNRKLVLIAHMAQRKRKGTDLSLDEPELAKVLLKYE